MRRISYTINWIYIHVHTMAAANMEHEWEGWGIQITFWVNFAVFRDATIAVAGISQPPYEYQIDGGLPEPVFTTAHFVLTICCSRCSLSLALRSSQPNEYNKYLMTFIKVTSVVPFIHLNVCTRNARKYKMRFNLNVSRRKMNAFSKCRDRWQ